MKTSPLLLTLPLLAILAGARAAEPVAPPAPATPAATLAAAVAAGKFSLHLRLRSEFVEQAPLRDAHALTWRTRLGFTTAPLHGWQAMIEAEHIVAADDDTFSQAGLNPSGAGRAVVADPEVTEINQAWLRTTRAQTNVTLGRQRLVLDNHRFIGDVGWRQNQQTFDALVVQDKTFAKTTLTYAYLDQINRVFGHRHAQGRWQSESHLFHGAWAGHPAGTLTGYVYLLDITTPAATANSNATYGLSFAGATPLNPDLKLTYRAEYARQTDAGSSRLDYAADYTLFEAGLALKTASLTLGREALGSDHNVGFKTPLATLHAFNGWADLFLATPAAGLRDTYAKGTAPLPGAISLVAFYHKFETDRAGADLGAEFDAQLSRKFGKSVTATVKYADFRRDRAAYPDVRKIWVQVEFAY